MYPNFSLMVTLDQIKAPLRDDLERYEVFLNESLGSDNGFVSSILDYIFSNRGKGIRPLLVLLGAGLNVADVPLGKRTFLAAMLVEMVHTTSLIHDDVIDEAAIRHGKPSVNARWNSRTSVLIGDYILAKTFSTGMDSGQYDVMAFITRSLGMLCEGELIQSEQSRKQEMSREIYLDIIYKKTATLLGTSSGVGALSVGASTESVERMVALGESLGMAFQIKDDILDYAPTQQTGKPAYGDLREGKITLPLLTVLEKSNPERRAQLLEWLGGMREHPGHAELISRVVVEAGGLDMAARIMDGYVDRARALLADYPASDYRTSLDGLCQYIARRDK